MAKIVHVVSAAMWAGGGLLSLLVVQPQLLRTSAGTRAEVMARLMPALNRYNNAIGGITLLSGIVLVTLHPHGWADITTSAWGRLVVFALIATLSALYLSGTSIRSTMKAMARITAELKPGEAPPPNMDFLQARLRLTVLMINGLVLLVLLLMVYANVLFAGF